MAHSPQGKGEGIEEKNNSPGRTVITRSMLLEEGIVAGEQEDNANDWNGELSIFFVYIINQLAGEGIHLREQFIEGWVRIGG